MNKICNCCQNLFLGYERLARGLALAGSLAMTACAGEPALGKASTNETIFNADFEQGKLDPQQWLLARRQWGGGSSNGGVVPENISVRAGYAMLEAHGDGYQGPVKGVERRGKEYVATLHGRRVGACLVTKDSFASGRYEVRARVPKSLGVCSAFWTFYYDEIAPAPAPATTSKARAKPQIINHEIDIELPGRPTPVPRDMAYDWMLCNTWLGGKAAECTISRVHLPKPVNDGAFHDYRIDWHTGGNGMAPKVEFFLDGESIRTTTTQVPFIAGHFWVGVWFPKIWAGKPDFDTEAMEVSRVRITPFHEPNDQFIKERDQGVGFARPDQWPAALRP